MVLETPKITKWQLKRSISVRPYSCREILPASCKNFIENMAPEQFKIKLNAKQNNKRYHRLLIIISNFIVYLLNTISNYGYSLRKIS